MNDVTPYTEDYELEAIAWVNTAIAHDKMSQDKNKMKLVTAYASIANVYATLALVQEQKNDRIQKS